VLSFLDYFFHATSVHIWIHPSYHTPVVKTGVRTVFHFSEPDFFPSSCFNRIIMLSGKLHPVRNSSPAIAGLETERGINPALRGGTPYGAEPGIILKSNPAAAAGPEGLPPGHEPFRGGAWPGGSSGALFLTG
jgi:hypothetical protein